MSSELTTTTTVISAKDATNNSQSLTNKDDLIATSFRLHTGRTSKLDVWSTFHIGNFPEDCIDLALGSMNFCPPQWVRDSANDALGTVSANHYAHPKGRIRLRNAIKAFYDPFFSRSLDVETEILVTSGVTEGMYSVYTAFLNPGDEVIMFEPFFDQYVPGTTFNGGTPVFVPLHPPPGGKTHNSSEWTVDIDELRRAVTPRSKMIIVNTPNNPVGKVFSYEELHAISLIAKEFNLLVLADEVYDCMVYAPKEHIRIATLPGMWERTLTTVSAGKMFAATGWRVGWLIGPKSLIGPTLAATTRIVFSTNSPLQEAVAYGLENAPKINYFPAQLKEYEERRNVFTEALDRIGLPYCFPEGAYFVLVDISKLKIPEDYNFPDMLNGRARDFKACWFISFEIGVNSLPISEFYCEEHSGIGENYARFCFAKDLDTLRRAAERLAKLADYQM
ncbi:PLP-dependent transferase [Hygrophoropsis aurantiaca]|uniref:PLP-dependent transferase n=1 Tax=Hygrophoropsis aurantiaca TaxID=72124 RepID=A0ACB8ABA9_9AGAM|nr:PLP-dependent transferase [Hygrophoropsis aurantiaca]